MSQNMRDAETTFSLDEIPRPERETYLLNLPPHLLIWALHAASERAMPDPCHNKRGDAHLFDQLIGLGSLGLIAAAPDLKTARGLALMEIEQTVPAILRQLDEFDKAHS